MRRHVVLMFVVPNLAPRGAFPAGLFLQLSINRRTSARNAFGGVTIHQYEPPGGSGGMIRSCRSTCKRSSRSRSVTRQDRPANHPCKRGKPPTSAIHCAEEPATVYKPNRQQRPAFIA